MNNNKYQLSKIYTIRHPDTDKFYIGSTCQQYLSKRFASHKKDYINKSSLSINSKNPTSSTILFNMGIDDCYIELLENYPCNSKLELEKREGELIRIHKDNIVNKNISGYDYKNNKTKYNKQYNEDNKEHIANLHKQYSKDNKEHISNRQKQYRKDNKEELKIKKKEYSKIKYTCECGLEMLIGAKSRHEKSQKHTNYMQTI
jgi:hypothetical protein